MSLNRFRSLCCLLPLAIAANLGAQSRDPRAEARAAVAAPFKVIIKPLGEGHKAGEIIDVSLQLQNGKSLPSRATANTPVQIQLLGKSGGIVKSTRCIIRASSDSAQCPLQAPQPGIFKLRAVPEDRQLLEGSGFLLVLPGDNKGPAGPRSSLYGGAFLFHAAYNAAYNPGDDGEPVFYKAVAQTSAQPGCNSQLSRGPAKVVLRISEGGEDGGAFKAEVESATIAAFFLADDGLPAPRDVRVWLSQDHGTLDPPVLIIPACSYSGETALSSKYPVVASIAYTVVPETYTIDAPATLVARFLRPIVAIHFEPDGPQTLSLIDRGPFVAELIDINGQVVSSDSNRNLKFLSNSSVAGPRQQSVSLKTGEFAAENAVLPFSTGKATISVSADRLKTAIHDVEVVGAAVYWCCLIGGILGGLIAAINAGPLQLGRIFSGVVSGIVLTWAYVFGVLPRVDSSVAHNYLSVLVIAILGGYMGTKTLDLVLKQLGWNSQM